MRSTGRGPLASFHACIAHENEIQKSAITAQDVMADTVAFCASVTMHASRPENTAGIEDGMLRENAEGLPEFAAHLFESGYDWRRMQLDMARVAWCVVAVATPAVDTARFQAVTGRTAPEAGRSADERYRGVNSDARYYWGHTDAVMRS